MCFADLFCAQTASLHTKNVENVKKRNRTPLKSRLQNGIHQVKCRMHFSLTSIHAVCWFILHREDAAKLTAGGDDDAIQRQEALPSEYLSSEGVQIDTQITPLHTDSSTISYKLENIYQVIFVVMLQSISL